MMHVVGMAHLDVELHSQQKQQMQLSLTAQKPSSVQSIVLSKQNRSPPS